MSGFHLSLTRFGGRCPRRAGKSPPARTPASLPPSPAGRSRLQAAPSPRGPPPLRGTSPCFRPLPAAPRATPFPATRGAACPARTPAGAGRRAALRSASRSRLCPRAPARRPPGACGPRSGDGPCPRHGRRRRRPASRARAPGRGVRADRLSRRSASARFPVTPSRRGRWFAGARRPGGRPRPEPRAREAASGGRRQRRAPGCGGRTHRGPGSRRGLAAAPCSGPGAAPTTRAPDPRA